MTGCAQSIQIGRYHDGQLSQEARLQVEAHIAQCDECAEQLAAMRKVSELVGRVNLEPITPMELLRMHRAADQAELRLAERRIMRIGTSLAAIAASVLVITSLCLAANIHRGAAASDSDQMAINMNTGPAAQGGSAGQDNSDAHNLSGWMVRNLGGDAP